MASSVWVVACRTDVPRLSKDVAALRNIVVSFTRRRVNNHYLQQPDGVLVQQLKVMLHYFWRNFPFVKQAGKPIELEPEHLFHPLQAMRLLNCEINILENTQFVR